MPKTPPKAKAVPGKGNKNAEDAAGGLGAPEQTSPPEGRGETRASSAPIPKVTVRPERGLAGTLNYSGRLYVDENPELVWERAFGTPGSFTWGEWERIYRTDPAVGTALNLIVAPLRDCEVTVEPATVKAPKGEGKAPAPRVGLDTEPAPPASTKPEGKPKPTTLADGLPPAPTDEDVDPDEELAEDSEADPALDIAAGDVAEEPAQSLEEVIAEFVQDNLTEFLAPGWPDVINTIVTWGLGSGFALFEKVYGTRDDDRVEGGKATFLAKLSHRLPSSIKADGWKEKNGDLAEVHQMGLKDGRWQSDIVLPAHTLLLCTWNRSGNNYAGSPAFRSVWYLAKTRAKLLRILGIGMEREALGFPVTEIDPGVALNDAQVDDLRDLVENIAFHEKAGAVMPPGVKINWVFSPGADKSSVLNTWRQLGTAMLEVVQAEQTTLGTGDTGSRSVGDTKTATKNGFVEGVRTWIESCFNGVGDQVYTGVIKELVDLNFGPQASYPKLKLVTKKSDIPLDEFATAAKALSDAGAITFTPEDENDLRERLGMQPIDPAVRQAEQDRKKAMANAIAAGQAPGGAPHEKGEALPAPSPEVAELKKELAEMRAAVRALSERPTKTLAQILEED